MDQIRADIGLIGLGVMGRNLALNVADHGFSIIGLDLDKNKVKALADEGDQKSVAAVSTMDEFLSLLRKPRAVMLLVPAGKPVDVVVNELRDRLDPGDIIIDGGNSHFTDTDRHAQELADKKINFLGVGVSGGSKGARYGPSIMPGGPKNAYERVQNILEAVSAKADGQPCVAYLGPGSAGHYVKMVHNGIEYALMQLISETYDILHHIGGLTNDEMADVFEKWNRGPLSSFLIEITYKILRVNDDDTGQRLVDMIQDAAKQKGTGKWTSQDAMELQVPVPTIDAAVGMRDLSGFKAEREQAAKVFSRTEHKYSGDKSALIDQLEKALHFGMITAYAQGMALLREASSRYEYNLPMADIAKIWRSGCIIRAALVNDMREVWTKAPDTPNMMTAQPFSGILIQNRPALAEMIGTAIAHAIPAPALSSALAYFDGYRSARLPANLVQAQRDFFGSHTYERIDREGVFHTDWAERKEAK